MAADGVVLAGAGADIARIDGHRRLASQGRHEQEPRAWWGAAAKVLRDISSQLARREGSPVELLALSVDGTSGTVVGVDAAGLPTTPALMYDDSRAAEQAAELEALRSSGISLSATSGLAKIRWLQQCMPAEFEATHVFLHQADLIAARLTGEVGVTDASNALKSGFDLKTGHWAEWIDQLPALRSRLPRVVEPGSSIGRLAGDVAGELGLPAGLAVVAGVTDGTAAFLASGATQPGEDNTTLGTTLVFKRVARAEVLDEGGLIYCHRLPGGVWLPGAASNVGGGWIRECHGREDLALLDAEAAQYLPSNALAYPLLGRGERFPFSSELAEGFCVPALKRPSERYAASLQGTALVERMAYEVLDTATGAQATGPVFATGGGSRSDVWLQLRSDVCGRTYHRPENSESAFGSAVLAAGNVLFDDLWQASRAMVRISASFRPDAGRKSSYDEYHARFRELLTQRGYL